MGQGVEAAENRREDVLGFLVRHAVGNEMNDLDFPVPNRHYSIEEYLTLERQSEERHEYIDGIVRTIESANESHATIHVNLLVLLGTQLKRSPFRPFGKGFLIYCGAAAHDYFSFPDLSIFHGRPAPYDEHRDVFLNPQIIIEILSPTSEAFDRGEKFIRYRTHLASLQDYLVVAQDKPLIERYSRQENGLWVIAETVRDLAATIHLPSINCAIPLAEIYEGIVFPAPSEPDETPS
jgi:Uma2 family endonuclease